MTNEAAERLRRLFDKDSVWQEKLDEALVAAKAEARNATLDEIEKRLEKVHSVVSDGGPMADVGYEQWEVDRILDDMRAGK